MCSLGGDHETVKVHTYIQLKCTVLSLTRSIHLISARNVEHSRVMFAKEFA